MIAHVFWPLPSNIEAYPHTQLLEQDATWIGVDREGTAGELLVVLYDIRLPTADDNDGGWNRYAEVVLHTDALGKGLDVQCTCRTVEVSDKDDELALMTVLFLLVQRAKCSAVAFRVVDREFLYRS